MNLSKRNKRLTLVLIGAAATGALAGCESGKSSEQPINVMRRGYSSVSECVADWGDTSQCEPASTADISSSAVSSGGRAVNPILFWGPYYTSAGQVYGTDGSVTRQQIKPANPNTPIAQVSRSPATLTSPSGAYARTPVGAARSAAIARGGFGGSFSSGG